MDFRRFGSALALLGLLVLANCTTSRTVTYDDGSSRRFTNAQFPSVTSAPGMTHGVIEYRRAGAQEYELEDYVSSAGPSVLGELAAPVSYVGGQAARRPDRYNSTVNAGNGSGNGGAGGNGTGTGGNASATGTGGVAGAVAGATASNVTSVRTDVRASAFGVGLGGAGGSGGNNGGGGHGNCGNQPGSGTGNGGGNTCAGNR